MLNERRQNFLSLSELERGFKEFTSSETQGQIVGTRESLNRRKNIYGTKKERGEEPLGAMSYQTSSKRSPPFWLLIGARKTQVFFSLFSPFFTFLRAIYIFPPV